VQAISQLDQHHAHVVNHGEQHLANIFGLLLFSAELADVGYLGEAFNQVRNFFAEIIANGVVSASVSSTTSWSRPVDTDTASRRMSARIFATSRDEPDMIRRKRAFVRDAHARKKISATQQIEIRFADDSAGPYRKYLRCES
jgi:hypothetical protein